MNVKKPFIKENISKIEPQQRGVYFLYNESEKVQYIGKSKDLRSRLTSHFRHESHLKDNINRIVYFRYTEYDENILDEIESALIMELKPPMNKHGKEKRVFKAFYLDADIISVIDNIDSGIKSDLVNECLRKVFKDKGLL